MRKQRIALDFYETQQAITEALLEELQLGDDVTIFEPCCGQGAISNVLPGIVITSDIKQRMDMTLVGDATQSQLWEEMEDLGGCDWVITNPPFKKATPILRYAMVHARVGVAFLLRLSYLEPTQERGDFLELAKPSMLMPLNPRPRCRTDTKRTDSVTLSWFVWRFGYPGNSTQLRFLMDWHLPRNEKRHRVSEILPAQQIKHSLRS